MVYVSHNNLLVVTRKFSSPGLSYFSVEKLCFRLHKFFHEQSSLLSQKICDLIISFARNYFENQSN